MHAVPVVFLADPAVVVLFYEALGLTVASRQGAPHWLELAAGESKLGLHATATSAHDSLSGSVQLGFETDPGESLEDVVARLTAAGFPVGPIRDLPTRRALDLIDPAGVPLEISEPRE